MIIHDSRESRAGELSASSANLQLVSSSFATIATLEPTQTNIDDPQADPWPTCIIGSARERPAKKACTPIQNMLHAAHATWPQWRLNLAYDPNTQHDTINAEVSSKWFVSMEIKER